MIGAATRRLCCIPSTAANEISGEVFDRFSHVCLLPEREEEASVCVEYPQVDDIFEKCAQDADLLDRIATRAISQLRNANETTGMLPNRGQDHGTYL